jgi:hypothetical protein
MNSMFDQEPDMFGTFSSNHADSLENYGNDCENQSSYPESSFTPKNNNIIDYFNQENFMGFDQFNETYKWQQLECNWKISTTDSTSLFPDPKLSQREAKLLECKMKRLENKRRLDEKWREKKLWEKLQDDIIDDEESFIEAKGKRNTIWNIVMPGKNRSCATESELKVLDEIESLIEK